MLMSRCLSRCTIIYAVLHIEKGKLDNLHTDEKCAFYSTAYYILGFFIPIVLERVYYCHFQLSQLCAGL